MTAISSSRDNSRRLSAVGCVMVQAITPNRAKSREQLPRVYLQGKIGKVGVIHNSAARPDNAQIVAYDNKDGYFRQSVCLCTARQF